MTSEICKSEIVINGVKVCCLGYKGHEGSHSAICSRWEKNDVTYVEGMSWFREGENLNVEIPKSAMYFYYADTPLGEQLEGIDLPEVFQEWWEGFQGVK